MPGISRKKKRGLKIVLWVFASVIMLSITFGGLFFYKIRYGFPVSYETRVPEIQFPAGQAAILLFSKSTGFRHTESTEAGKKSIADLAIKNNWFLYTTEEGGVFNPAQLSKFQAVIFNNCTGRLLNEVQQKSLENYVTQGGTWIGIHGAGENSHQWKWFDENLIGARFSHHPVKNHLQETSVFLNPAIHNSLTGNLPQSWTHTDEWYVFFDQPEKNGFKIIYSIDGEKINPDGNFLWIKNKKFGMGKQHPVAWYRKTGAGFCFYTSIGHDAEAWKQPGFVKLLENEISTASGINQTQRRRPQPLVN